MVAAFDGGAVTSDAGAVLLCETDRAIGLIGRVAACFSDGRDPGQLIDALPTLVGQRIVAIALGYEDVNDHDRLRFDPVLALFGDSLEAKRKDCGAAGGQEHDEPAGTCPRRGGDRYHKIGCDREARQDVFVDVFLDAHGRGTMPPTIPCTATKGRVLPRLLRLLVVTAALRFLPAAVGGEAQALEHDAAFHLLACQPCRRQANFGSTIRAMAQMKPTSSRAIATTTSGAGLPAAVKLAVCAESCIRAFQEQGDRLRQPFQSVTDDLRHPRREPVRPSRRDQAGPCQRIAGPTPDRGATGRRVEPEKRHQLARRSNRPKLPTSATITAATTSDTPRRIAWTTGASDHSAAVRHRAGWGELTSAHPAQHLAHEYTRRRSR